MNQAGTFDDAMRDAKGAATGFDYLRLGLALYVFLWHCLSFSDPQTGSFVWSGWFGPFHRAALPMFFALSGFLVAGSFARNDIAPFVALRALRIVPALAVEIAVSAILIGPAFTTRPLADYFASTEFWAYFLNIVGDIHYTLPGVFDGMRINGQLWTIPIEFQCYLALVVLGVTGLGRRRHLVLTTIAVVSLCLTYTAVRYDLVNNGPAAPSLALTLSFLCGVCVYMYKDVIPRRYDLALLCVAASYASLYVNNFVFLSIAPLAYVVVFAGLSRLPRLRGGDLSYGLYLFHCPILACVLHLDGNAPTWWRLVLFGLPPTLACACLSWTFVESPALRRKAQLLEFLALARVKRRGPVPAA